MKPHKILFGSLLALSLGACNNENGTDRDGSDGIQNPAYAQLSLSFADAMMSKASTTVRDSSTDAGSVDEQTITNVNILFVSEDGTIAHNQLLSRSQLTPDAISEAYNTPTFKVPEGTYNVFVGVNMGTLANGLTTGASFDSNMVFSATNGNASAYASAGSFLMSNYASQAQKITLSRTDNTEQNPLRISMQVCRAVAKIEYNPGRRLRDFSFDVSSTSGGIAGTVNTQLMSMQAVSLNTTSYVFGHRTGENYIDPNFGTSYQDGQLTDASQIDINAMESLLEGTEPEFPSMYCLENTDDVTYNGESTPADHFTSILFQARHTPEASLWHTDAGLSINDTPEANGTFFIYNNRFFANKTGFLAYLQANSSSETHTAVTGLLNNVENDSYTLQNSTTLAETYGIFVYYKGMSYYTATIGHSTTANPSDGQLSPMEYGVVRNHWYKVGVSSISGLGDVVPDIPEEPVEEQDANIQMEIQIQPWTVILNDFAL